MVAGIENDIVALGYTRFHRDELVVRRADFDLLSLPTVPVL